MSAKSIMVTGASGQLGSLVVKELQREFKGKLIAGTRDPQKIEGKFSGVELRAVDFDHLSDNAFRGVEKLLIISTDALAVPGLRLKQHLAAIKVAKAQGVKHILYTSLTQAQASPIFFAPDHLGTEEAMMASGITYTILRNNWYIDNLLTYHDLPGAKKSGALYAAAGDGKTAFISREDCARIAAKVLLSDKFDNKILDVTGEKSYSYEDLARLIGARYVSLSEEERRGGLTQAGLPSFVVDLFVTFEKAVRDGKQDVTNHLVRELTGVAPVSLEDVLKKL